MSDMPKIVLATRPKHLQATSLGCEKSNIIYGLVVLVGWERLLVRIVAWAIWDLGGFDYEMGRIA